MKHHVCAWYVRTLLYVHVCTDIAQYITYCRIHPYFLVYIMVLLNLYNGATTSSI